MAEKNSKFEPLPIPRKELLNKNPERYRVYKNSREYVVVEASTAKQALEVSGVTEALRILPESVDIDRVLEEQVWAKKTAEATGTPAPVEPVEVPASPKEETPS